MLELVRTFPREVMFCNGRIVCQNRNDFFDILNKNNTIAQKMYFSLYDITENPAIDWIGLDIDRQESLAKLKQLHIILLKLNIRHFMFFSTRGFWILVKTKHKKLRYAKEALKSAQKYVAYLANMTIGDPKMCDVDEAVIGDIRRMCRVPNSFDVLRKRFAIPIGTDVLDSYGLILEKSLQQQKGEFYGIEALDITQWDIESRNILVDDIPDCTINITEDFLKDLPTCVATMLKSGTGWKKWFYTILWFKEKGYTKEQIIQIFKKYLDKYSRGNKDYFLHIAKEDKQFDYVFAKGYIFPRCEQLWDEGFCVGKCSHFNTLYK